MILASFSYSGKIGIGAVVAGEIVNASARPGVPDNMIEFLAQGQTAKDAMQNLIESGRQRLDLNDVRLQAPVPRPGKYLGVALNYADHIEETGRDKPEYPTFFTKQATCVIGPSASIEIPRVSTKVDYEGELAFVIGRRCRHVGINEAAEVIAGYTIANDVSVRDWQVRSPTMMLGKSFDTHGPLGPWLVTADAINDPHQLDLKTWVDDELRQHSNTQNMIFNCYELIAYLSQVMTLEPGDVIATGTPSGVGVKMTPRGYLQPGQTVVIEIEGIGKLTNSVIAEPIR